MYFISVSIFIAIDFFIIIILLVMAFKIKNNTLNIIWPISILKIILPIFSYSFFSQSFLLLMTIFDCRDGNSYVSENIKCRTGIWFYFLAPLSAIALFFQSIFAIITNILYFKPMFINDSIDILKKTNTFPDVVLVFTKIGINILFVSDKGKENEHWSIIFILILFTGTNAYYNLYYQHKTNKTLVLLNNIFCLITLSSFICLFIGKLFKSLEFNGSIYLFFSSIVIIIIFVFIFKNDEINIILFDYADINDPIDFLFYIYKYHSLIQNKDNSRNYLALLKSLISEIEESCIISDCPLKKYLENLKVGIESPFLLEEYCGNLFQYGITKFPDNVSLRINYAFFLITRMNNKKKALIILNNIKNQKISFQDNYEVYRALNLIDKETYSFFNKNNPNLEHRKNIQEFKTLIKKLILLYYDFMSLLWSSRFKNIDNFKELDKIGCQIMKYNPKIDKIYNKLTCIKTDNIEIIKLYSEFVEGVLKDEEKLEKCKKISKLTYSNNTVEIHEKDFSNFDIGILNEKGNLPYLLVSAEKENLGKIINLSMNLCKIFGYTKNELINQNINILIPRLFHQKHDLIIKQLYEKNKLKIFEDLNKNNIYLPDFIKKDVYGISKMKFLLELKLNIYFIKTEENQFVFLVEIINYNPIMIDLIKNSNYNSKFCVLTDKNFLIQTFTPNCLEYLKLNYEIINSNYSIINFIEQFHNDYLTALNNTIISKHSHINNNSGLYDDDKLPEKLNYKNINISPFIKSKIKNDLLIKNFSKRCRITWRIGNDYNLISSLGQNFNDKTIKYTRSNVFNQNKIENYKNNNDLEIELYMEIEKIILKKELLGYYFYFFKIHKKNYNNMSYVIQKYKTNDKKNFITNLKKYQCKFKISESYNEQSSIYKNKNQMFTSLIVKNTKFIKNENKNNFFFNKAKTRNLEQKVLFKEETEEEKNSINSNSFIFNNNELTNILDISQIEIPNDTDTISGEFIPELSSHFSLNVERLSFIKNDEENEEPNYIEYLKKEALNKIKKFQEQFKLFDKSSISSYESKEKGSNESSSEINSKESYETPNSNSNSSSSSENKNYQNSNSKSNAYFKESINDSLKAKTKRKEEIKNSEITLKEEYKKSAKRNSIDNDYYRINFKKNFHFMVFDFNKDMIVPGDKKLISSKIESLMNDTKQILDKEDNERFSFITLLSNKIKNKENKEEDETKEEIDDKIDDNKKNINEEKLIEIKISEALNAHKEEQPIKRLRIFAFLSYFIMLIYTILCIILDLIYLGYIKKIFNIIQKIIFIKYCSHISIYYFRELTLLNFDIVEIEGGEYYKFPDKNKDDYIYLIKDEIMRLFIENQSSMKELYSYSLPFSKNMSKILSETLIDIKLLYFPIIDTKYDIFGALMQYNSAFYNLASSTIPIRQNVSDLYNFIYNNLNGYRKAINILINLFHHELEINNDEIKAIVITICISLIICYVVIYYFILINFFSAIETRGNYMKIFYCINENILKNLINNCENLINKLKSSEEQKFHEDETLYESVKNKDLLEKNSKRKTTFQNSHLNYDNDYKIKNKVSSYSITFVILYLIFILISFTFFIFNGFFMIKGAKRSVLISEYFYKIQKIQLGIIDMFNSYREFLFDNQSFINEMISLEYLSKAEKEELITMSDDIKFLNSNYDKIKKNSNETIEANLCSYYLNNFFDSSDECSDIIGLISKYDFFILSYNFLEEIKININIVKYKLKYENVLGNLTEYKISDYINDERIPRKYNNIDPKTIFRLDFFNNETLHYKLNLMFFSIILPYIEKNREITFNLLSVEGVDKIIILSCIIFCFIITLIFFFYFLPIINLINNVIYKTKNMLSIIPLNILSTQNGIKTLLNISKNE